MDLVDKFFVSDLSLAEEETLDSLLASSGEAAERFAEKAAEAYALFGLPDPEGDSAGKTSTGRKVLVLLVLALALAFGSAFWRHGLNFLNPSSPRGQSLVPSAGLSKALGGKNKAPLPAASSLSGSSTESSMKSGLSEKPGALSATENQSEGAVSTQRIAPTLAPPAGVPQAKVHSRLRISVNIGQDGPVTVEILGATGLKVKNLYSGFLPAGNYSFSWDGKLEDGQRAPPGDYRIETQSGATVQTQDFSIQK